MHAEIDEQSTVTTYSEAPKISLAGGVGELPDLHFDYPVSDITQNKYTHVVFTDVQAYRWSYFDLRTELWNTDDSDLQLIEILDSELVRNVLDMTHSHGAPLDTTSGHTRRRESLRHYRICFDHHGTYDVVCRDVVLKVRQDPGAQR